MTEGAPIFELKGQLEAFPNFDFAYPFMLSTDIIAAILGFVAAFHFYRYYRLSGSLQMLGLAIGFFAITFSQVMLAVDVWLGVTVGIFNLLFWLGLLSLSYGFCSIAASYYYRSRVKDRTPWLWRIGALSLIPVIITIAISVMIPPALEFAPYNQADEYFRIVNLTMLVYAFRSSLVHIVERERKEFMYVPAAYGILLLGQYSALITDLEPNVGAFVAQNLSMVIGLAIFVGVLSQESIMKKTAKSEKDGEI